MGGKISRRHFLGALAAAAGITGVTAITNELSPTLLAKNQAPMQPVIDSFVYLPRVSRENTPTPTPTDTPTVEPGALRGRVVQVHSNNVTTWGGQTDYWNYVNQNVVNNMVDAGLMSLTGQSSVADAWRAILPAYRNGQKIAIKINLNNQQSCNDTDGQIDALIQPVNAVVRGLKLIGVAEADVWVYDAIRHIGDRYVSGCLYPGVKFWDDACRVGTTAGFGTTTVTFTPPAGVTPPGAEKVTTVLVNADYLINMPILKMHEITMVTLGFKNHFGSINAPILLHDYVRPTGQYFRTDYNPLVDIYKHPNIGPKTVLTLGDGIFGSRDGTTKPPTVWTTFGNKVPSSLFFATDPVAIDSVMCDFVMAEQSWLDPRGANYLALASAAGLGVFERGDPWHNGYHTINYSKLQV